MSRSPLILRAALNIPVSNTMSTSNGSGAVIWEEGMEMSEVHTLKVKVHIVIKLRIKLEAGNETRSCE